MTYEVSPAVQSLVDKNLASGLYSSTNEVLLDALHALELKNSDLAEIRMGIADMEAGRMRPMAEVAEEIRAQLGL